MNFDELVAGAAVTFWCLAGLQVHQASGVSPFLEEQICADSPYRRKGFLLYVGNRRARQFLKLLEKLGSLMKMFPSSTGAVSSPSSSSSSEPEAAVHLITAFDNLQPPSSWVQS